MPKTTMLILALPFAAFAQDGAQDGVEALFLRLADEAAQALDRKADSAENIAAFTARMMESLPHMRAAVFAECLAENAAGQDEEKRAACRCYADGIDYRRAFAAFAMDLYLPPLSPQALAEHEAVRAHDAQIRKNCGLGAK